MLETAVKLLFERYGAKYRAFVAFTVVLGIVSMLLNATMINVAALQMLGTSLYAQANMLAFRDVFLFLGMTYFIAMVPATLLRIPKSKAALPGRAGGETRAVGNV